MLEINFFALPPFFSALLIMGIGLFMFYKNPRSVVHRAHSYFCLSVFVWLICYTVMYCCKDPETALKWARMGCVGVLFIPLTNLYFNIRVLKIHNKRLFLIFLTCLTGVFLGLSHTPYYYLGSTKYFWGYYPIAGPIHGLFLLSYIAIWSYGLWLLYQKIQEKKKANDFMVYHQIKYIFIAWLGGSLGIVDFLPKYGIPVYPFAYLVALYWVLITSFAITRYQLLSDISFITRRFLIISAFCGTIVGLFGVSYFFIHIFEWTFLPISATTLLVTASLGIGLLFQPLYRKIKDKIDRTFFPEYFERKEKLARLGQGIAFTQDSTQFNRILMETLFSSFKIIKSSFFTWSEKEKVYLLKATTGWGMQPNKSAVTHLSQDHLIVQYLQTKDDLLLDKVGQNLSTDPNSRALLIAMLELEATLCIPIRFNEKLIGFFVLGDKESGLPYGLEDLKSLKNFSDQVAMALENMDLNRRWSEGVALTDQMDKILHRYLSGSVADEVLKRVHQAQNWAGERRYVTVLIADLRGFTSVSETNTPEEIVHCLNEYFSEIIEIVLSHGGSVDKFMGDAVLVVFGAPTPLAESEVSAVSCALEMQNSLKRLNEKRAAKGLFTLEMGIGICAGDVVAGNIGSDKRMDFTVIGDPVNMASKLQSLAGPGEIYITASLAGNDKLKDVFKFSPAKMVKIKGKNEMIAVSNVTEYLPKFEESEKWSMGDVRT